MAELNSLDDVLKLCRKATPETLEATIQEALTVFVELGLLNQNDMSAAFTMLNETTRSTVSAFIKAVFPVVVELSLSEVELTEVFRAMKSVTNTTLTALKKDFATYLRANDFVAEPSSIATVLIRLAEEKGIELWHDPEGNPWATLRIGSHVEHHRLKSEAVRRYLIHLYYTEHKNAPNSQAVHDALTTLGAKAVIDGPMHPTHTRLAEEDGVIYIDLANEDWEVVRVSALGWALVAADAVPVHFRRPRGMLALPTPMPGGSLEPLAELLNVEKDSRDYKLIVVWLLQALRGVGPYPVLVLTGEQGSGKSTAAKMLRALVDPNVSPLRSLPRDERDLFIAAVNGWALAFDNISGLSRWTSDALCKLSTGGGFSTRELFSDDEETLLDALRPVVLNGITDFVDKQDLVDRALQVRLPSIPKDKRRPEAAIWKRFDEARPGVLGALLDVAVKGLGRLPHTQLETLPRLADFALWATACEDALAWGSGDFVEAFDAAQDDLIKDALEAEPVATHLLTFLQPGQEWTGTASKLLTDLTAHAGFADKRPPKGWPGAAHVLVGTLKRVAPALLAQKLKVTQLARDGKDNTKKWRLEWLREDERSERSKAFETEQDDVLAPNASKNVNDLYIQKSNEAFVQKELEERDSSALNAPNASSIMPSDDVETDPKWEGLDL